MREFCLTTTKQSNSNSHMSDEAKKEDTKKKEEPKKGKFLACVVVYDHEVGMPDGMTLKQFDRIFKSETAAQREVYDWLKSEFLGKRDVREFLEDKDGDDEDFEPDHLVQWLKANKRLSVEYETEELDE